MQSVIVDILNKKALKLLQDLEQLELIRLHKSTEQKEQVNWADYKGAMTKQPLSGIESQLKELREGWE